VAALASILPGKAILAGRRRGTGPGSGRRDRAGARRGLGHQPAAGDGEGSGRANGRPEESPPGEPRGRVVRPQTTRAAVPGDPGPHTSAAPPAASAAVPVSGLRPAAGRVVTTPEDSAHDFGRAVTHDRRARGRRDLPSVVRRAGDARVPQLAHALAGARPAARGLQQASPAGDGWEPGPRRCIHRVTLSDRCTPGERTHSRRYGRQLDCQFDCLNCVPNGRFGAARLSWVTDPG
jgi:hypothetical protein